MQRDEMEQQKVGAQVSAKQVSQNSEKYFVSKFTKEIIKLWSDITNLIDESSQNNETLN
jgi:hypothetical protein